MHVRAVYIHSVAVSRIYNTRVSPAGGHIGGKDISRYYLIELETDTGLRGLGEVSDLEAEWGAPPPAELRETLAAVLVGADPLLRLPTWQRAEAALPAAYHPEFRNLVSAAVDVALLDLMGQHYNAPIHALLGGMCRADLQVSWVAYIRSAAELEEEIVKKIRLGFTAFKLKVGAEAGLDDERIRVFRRIAGPDVYLKVDASGAWEEDEAIDRIRMLATLGVDAVETPIRAVSRTVAKDHPEQVNADPDAAAMALARVREAVPTDLIEHVADFDDAFALALLRHRAVDVFNIVPVQAGSLHRAQRLVHIAESGGVSALLGSTVELGIGTAAAIHLGVSCKAVSVASDLVGPGLLQGDVISPRLEYRQGRLNAPTGPGLGVGLDPALVKKYETPP